ncbi:MAG: EAL domain-containing protein [Cyanobacteriota bacterium]|nr:EAL domain-containing protein [Cyanobacteriota bacterium]
MKKILVIEDDQSIRKLVLKLLSKAGYEAIAAENGKKGVELARGEAPNLILCDIMMPELDGYGVLSTLQEDSTTAMIPFICLTAKDERATLRQVMQLGANDFLTKPFTRDELLSAIATQLNKYETIEIQKTKAVEEALSKFSNLVYFDSSTNIPNQLVLRDRFQQLLTSFNPSTQLVPVAVLSLDQFEQLNYSLGTDYCDLLLQAVVDRLMPYANGEGTVARLNTELLALILPPVSSLQAAVAVARGIVETLEGSFTLVEHNVFITCSMGVALYPDEGSDIDNLLKNAKAAMYRAKRKGGNSSQIYAKTIQEKSYDRLMLETGLRNAIDDSQLRLHYQPKINIQTGKVIGVEALVRWEHPERGLISPAEFIPLAEETGLILPLDEWVLRAACKQADIWKKAGLHIPVAVNLSGRQFNQPGLSLRIINILETVGLDPSLLELELTESAVVQNPTVAIATLKKLKAIGISLSLDDFGTGYSSLSYLQQFPFDILKIDRCFVRNLTPDSKGAALISAILRMAESLNLKAIAEGVETEAELEMLRQNKCSIIQGYWFSPPLQPEALLDKLQVGIGNSLL